MCKENRNAGIDLLGKGQQPGSLRSPAAMQPGTVELPSRPKGKEFVSQNDYAKYAQAIYCQPPGCVLNSGCVWRSSQSSFWQRGKLLRKGFNSKLTTKETRVRKNPEELSGQLLN